MLGDNATWLTRQYYSKTTSQSAVYATCMIKPSKLITVILEWSKECYVIIEIKMLIKNITFVVKRTLCNYKEHHIALNALKSNY